jgi:hypothetical protein
VALVEAARAIVAGQEPHDDVLDSKRLDLAVAFVEEPRADPGTAVLGRTEIDSSSAMRPPVTHVSAIHVSGVGVTWTSAYPTRSSPIEGSSKSVSGFRKSSS